MPVGGEQSEHDCRADIEAHQTRGSAPVPQMLRSGPKAASAIMKLDTLSVLALPVIPEPHITNQGLFDVRKQQFVRLRAMKKRSVRSLTQ
jgi:hypothetical protein